MAQKAEKSSHIRKTNKSLMEKCRRARINDCLNELKSLVLEAMKRDTSRYSKLEKADILEMTVKHIRNIQRHQMAVAVSHDPTVVNRYKAGFNECAHEVTRYLSSIDGVNSQVKARVLNHLASCVQTVHNNKAQTNHSDQSVGVTIQIPTPTFSAPGTCHQTSTMTSPTGIVTLPKINHNPVPVALPNQRQMSLSQQSTNGAIQLLPSSVSGNVYVIPTGTCTTTSQQLCKQFTSVIPVYSSLPIVVNTPTECMHHVHESRAEILRSPQHAMVAPTINHTSATSTKTDITPNLMKSANITLHDDNMWRPW